MKENFTKLLKILIGVEGGISDRPLSADPGGLTNKGVTQKAYDRWREAQGLEPRSVVELTVAEYTKLYKTDYWDLIKGDKLPSGLDCVMFDYCVNSGPKQPVVDLQRALGTKLVDGIIGRETLLAVAASDLTVIINSLCDLRLKFMRSLRNWKSNKNGWTARVAHVREVGLGMVQGTPVPAAPPMTAADTGKAVPSSTAQLKTAEGAGLSAAGCGAGGQAILSTAQQVQPQIGETVFGRLALAVFLALTLIGGVLVGYSYLRRIKEAGGLNNFIGGLFNAKA